MKIGNYVRTKRGLIGKIVNINTFREPCMKYGIEASYLDDIWFIGDDDIKLVKEELVDLIEVGDYVNGHKVFKKEQCELRVEDRENTWGISILDETDIKSIVTKEQFEAIEYRIGE